jgi:hypothetical protein
VPEPGLRARTVRLLCIELRQRAGVLKQQSRLLRRHNERLQDRSSDLLTICWFRRESRGGRRPQAPRAPLALLS